MRTTLKEQYSHAIANAKLRGIDNFSKIDDVRDRLSELIDLYETVPEKFRRLWMLSGEDTSKRIYEAIKSIAYSDIREVSTDIEINYAKKGVIVMIKNFLEILKDSKTNALMLLQKEDQSVKPNESQTATCKIKTLWCLQEFDKNTYVCTFDTKEETLNYAEEYFSNEYGGDKIHKCYTINSNDIKILTIDDNSFIKEIGVVFPATRSIELK